jgi:hypothetical protein
MIGAVGLRFSIEETSMTSWSGYTRCFNLRGEGDIAAATAIQARLREHGMCSYFGWDPQPPRWRFFYETDLSQAEVELVLGSLVARFRIVIEN